MKDWISLINALAWPFVAVLALVYIWQSDAIAKLIRISDSVKDLKAKLAELVETERDLSERSASISEIVSTLKRASDDFVEIKTEVEIIRDRVDEESVQPAPENNGTSGDRSSAAIEAQPSAEKRLGRMEAAWNELLQQLGHKFGDFDKRSVAGDVYRYAHGNRKGEKLTYDTADEIARLHSSIKSYRRRKSTIASWLDEETSNKFIDACQNAMNAVERDTSDNNI